MLETIIFTFLAYMGMAIVDIITIKYPTKEIMVKIINFILLFIVFIISIVSAEYGIINGLMLGEAAYFLQEKVYLRGINNEFKRFNK